MSERARVSGSAECSVHNQLILVLFDLRQGSPSQWRRSVEQNRSSTGLEGKRRKSKPPGVSMLALGTTPHTHGPLWDTPNPAYRWHVTRGERWSKNTRVERCPSVATKEMQIKTCRGIPVRVLKPCLAVPNTAKTQRSCGGHSSSVWARWRSSQHHKVVWEFVIKLNNNAAWHPYSWAFVPPPRPPGLKISLMQPRTALVTQSQISPR